MTLYLTYVEKAVPECGHIVVTQLSRLSLSYGKDPAGRVYHQFALLQRGILKDETPKSDEDEAAPPPSATSSASDLHSIDEDASANAKWKGKTKKKKKSGREDLYDLLGLSTERWMATEEQIKAAYRKTALVHHPDKAGTEAGAREAAEARFKRVQVAYETLLDPAKRREFDSTDAFDDSIPLDCAAGDFFQVFGVTFRRNARWSSRQPVPDLGAEDAPLPQVQRFYDFWYRFQSWREFPHPEEEDVEGAESREHRRWIERQNAKLRVQATRAEARRLRDLVEAAERLDPRLLAHKNAAKNAREAKKHEKAAAAERARAEAAAAEERAKEEAAAAAAAAALAKKQRDAAKKAASKARQRLRRACAALREAARSRECVEEQASAAALEDEDVEAVASGAAPAALAALAEGLERALGAGGGGVAGGLALAWAAVKAAGRSAEREEEARAAAAARVQAAAKEREAREKAAREEELGAWDEEEVRLLRKALAKFPPGTARRWEVVQTLVPTRTVAEILSMVKHGLASAKYSGGVAGDTYVVPKKRAANTVIQSAADQRDAAFSDVAVQAEVEAAVWTDAEDRALIHALKEVPKDDGERWDKVARAVGSKEAAECAAHFKELKAALKRAAAAKAAPQ